MTRRLPTARVVPIVAFLAALGAAGWVTQDARRRPAFAVHERVVSYLRALARGDEVAAASHHDRSVRGGLLEERRRARELAGRLWLLRRLTPVPGGWEAAVVWELPRRRLFGRGGTAAFEEVQRWGEGPDGAWRLRGLR